MSLIEPNGPRSVFPSPDKDLRGARQIQETPKKSTAYTLSLVVSKYITVSNQIYVAAVLQYLRRPAICPL
jgi:hypothetical protein